MTLRNLKVICALRVETRLRLKINNSGNELSSVYVGFTSLKDFSLAFREYGFQPSAESAVQYGTIIYLRSNGLFEVGENDPGNFYESREEMGFKKKKST